VSASWFVQPVDHLHVIAIDVSGAGPYTMNLQLPVMNELQLNSRMYFFYVSQANAGDFLVFKPTSESGDTVNGDATSFTFTLTGTKQLLFCLGVNGNYIIHEFGGSGGGSSTASTPMLTFNANLNTDGGTIPLADFPTETYLNPFGLKVYTSENGFDATPSATEYIPGMDGYVTYVSSIPSWPGGTMPGWACTVAGIYRITYQCNGIYLSNSDNIPAPPQPGFGGFITVVHYTPSIGDAVTSNFGTDLLYNGDTAFCQNGSGTFITIFEPGTYVAAGCMVDGTWGPFTTWGGQADYSKISFEYLGPIPPDLLSAPGPSALRGLSAPGPSSSTPSLISPMHKQLPVGQIKAFQKKTASAVAAAEDAKKRKRAQSDYSSSSDAPAPAISLSDIERIVQQAISRNTTTPTLTRTQATTLPPPPPAKRTKKSPPPPPSDSSKSAGKEKE
jgi:hypothetical protein